MLSCKYLEAASTRELLGVVDSRYLHLSTCKVSLSLLGCSNHGSMAFDTANFFVRSKEDNIVSATVSNGKFYILISGGDLLSMQLSDEVMELDDAELEVPNVNDVFFGQDKGYVFTDGQVVTLSDSHTQARQLLQTLYLI